MVRGWTLKDEIEAMRQAGWKLVSKHKKKALAHKKARKSLQTMFKQKRLMPQVKVIPFGNRHLVFKTYLSSNLALPYKIE